MARTKALSDAAVLDMALAFMLAEGPDALTFARLSAVCGLSAPTLVQRFTTKAALRRAALLHAWDRLEARTADLAERLPRTPAGAIALLVGLSDSFGSIEAYANGLLLLREDLRDPVLRARGKAWKAALTAALDRCFPDWPPAMGPIAPLIAAQWQGALSWWSFDPEGPVARHVEVSLERFIQALLARPPVA